MRKVRRDLVVSPVSFDEFPKRFNVYLELPDRVIVPQFWARDTLGVQDTRGPSVPMRSTTFLGNLRKELSQPEAAAAAEKSLRDTGGALLALPTGYVSHVWHAFRKLGSRESIDPHIRDLAGSEKR